MKENKFRVYCEIEFEGKLEKRMESAASWFLLAQTGKLWSYGPGQVPQPLEKEYKVAIPLFYVGKKDEDGIKIYDGDVVEIATKYDDGSKCDEAGEKYEVVWGKFEDCCVQGETWILKGRGWQPTVWAWPLKVIGNKYMNSELLEKK